MAPQIKVCGLTEPDQARACAHMGVDAIGFVFFPKSPRNVSIEEVGNAAAFLCSDLAAGITGEILYVDAGFSAMGMGFPAP